MPYVIVTLWILGVSCLVRGAALVAPAAAWAVTGGALLATMVWTLRQQPRR